MTEAKKGIHHHGKKARIHERILRLPVGVVLKIVWLAGAASVGLLAALYLYWLALWAAAGG